MFIASAKKQLPYVTQNVALFTNEQFKPEYLEINPQGVVPAPDHDGRIVIEASLICEYFDECFPAPRLVPADPYLRAHAALASTCRRHGLAAWQPE